jgi:DNA-binding transcriptional ArsR family regulator
VTTYQHPLDALGDPTRRTIFELLRSGPRPVGELARELPVSRPAVSQHLRVLKEAGLVTDRPHGNRRVYSVQPAALEDLKRYIDSFWAGALESFKSVAEQERQGGGRGESR